MLRQFTVLTFFVIALASFGVLAQCPTNPSKTDITMIGNLGYFTITKDGVWKNGQAFFPFNKETRIPVEDDVRNSFGPFGPNYRISTRTAIMDPNTPNQLILIELIRQRKSGYLKSWLKTNLNDFSDAISFTQTVLKFSNWGTKAASVSYSVTDALMDNPDLVNDEFFMRRTDFLQALANHPTFNVQNLSDPNFMNRDDMRYFKKAIDVKGYWEYGYRGKDDFKFFNCIN